MCGLRVGGFTRKRRTLVLATCKIWLPLGAAAPPGSARPRCDSPRIQKIKHAVDTLRKSFPCSTDHK